MTSGGVRSKTLGKDLTIVFGGFFFPRIRPVIVKLHHDYLLSPKNTEQDTNTLPPEFKKNLTPVLEGVHLIVIGYGGYDTGIMGYLREIFWA
jgi:hypothetical protein